MFDFKKNFIVVTLAWIIIGITNSASAAFTAIEAPIYLTNNSMSGVITVTNTDPYSYTTFQVTPLKWQSSHNLKSRNKPTKKILASPRIFKLGPNKKQVVRIAAVMPNKTNSMQRFHLNIAELHKQDLGSTKKFIKSLTGRAGTVFRTAVNAPIYFLPNKIHFSILANIHKVDNNTFILSLHNRSNVVAKLSSFSLLGKNSNNISAKFVMPKSKPLPLRKLSNTLQPLQNAKYTLKSSDLDKGYKLQLIYFSLDLIQNRLVKHSQMITIK